MRAASGATHWIGMLVIVVPQGGVGACGEDFEHGASCRPNGAGSQHGGDKTIKMECLIKLPSSRMPRVGKSDRVGRS